MPALLMMITDAGLDALVDAENAVTGPIEIVSVGLTDTPFVMAPTLEALPGQHKLINTISGQAAADNIIHVTAYDTSADAYDVTGFGLYLVDGTLFAVYSSVALPILTKAQLAFGLFSFDVAFLNNAAANITFGNAIFSYPPATEVVKGIARIATQARVNAPVDAADDFETIVTPKTLRARLAAFLAPITASLDALLAGLAALTARTITGGGLVTGGGDLSANRVLTVTPTDTAALLAGAGNGVVTAGLLGGLSVQDGVNGWEFLPAGKIEQWGKVSGSYAAETVIAVPFHFAFPQAVYNIEITTTIANSSTQADFFVQLIDSSRNTSGFSVQVQRGDGFSGAISGFEWRAKGK